VSLSATAPPGHAACGAQALAPIATFDVKSGVAGGTIMMAASKRG